MSYNFQAKQIVLKPTPVALIFSAICILVHMIFASNYELHRDEFLYLALGQHLDWGYASVPPLIGLISRLVSISGLPVDLGLKFMAAIAGSFTAFLTVKIAANLGGKPWTWILAGAAYLLSLAYNRTAWLFMPVVFDVMFWTLVLYYFIELIHNQDPKKWIPLGFFCGLGMLNKYTLPFLIVGMFFTLFITSNRKLIFTKSFLLGIGLGLLVFLPNLIWQITHDFPVIRHMMQLKEDQLDHVSLGDFIVNQFLMNLHALPLWLTGLIGGLILRKQKALFVVACTFCFTILLFILGSAKAYYTLGLYPALFATGAIIVDQYASRLIKWILLILMICLSIPLMPLALPLFKHDQMVAFCKKIVPILGDNLLKWEDGQIHDLPQDYADMTGWEEMAGLIEAAYNSLSPEDKLNATIYCENYGQAGAVNYYCKGRIPDPVSFSDNYLLWAPDSIHTDILIYVNDEIEEISTHFDEVIEFGRLKNPYARETGLPVYICRKPKDIQPFYSRLVKELKASRF